MANRNIIDAWLNHPKARTTAKLKTIASVALAPIAASNQINPRHATANQQRELHTSCRVWFGGIFEF